MTPLPLISLLDVIAAEVERAGCSVSRSLAARVTIQAKLFGRLQNVEVVTPSPTEVELLSNVYVRIVEEEQASAKDCVKLRALAHKLIDRERLDAILLAGSDLSLVFNPDNTDFPHLDGVRTDIAAIMHKLAP